MSESPDTVETTQKKRRFRVTRRGFLIGAGSTAALGAVGLAFGVPYGRLRIADLLDSGEIPVRLDAEPMAWYEFNDDNTVTIFVPKVEMGQGIHTAAAQLGAEELEISMEQVKVVQTANNQTPVDGFGTGGSASVTGLFNPMREAGATVREMVKAEAARKMGKSVSQITVSDGVFSDGSQSMTYAEIISGVTEWEVPEEAPALKSPDQWKIIGKPIQRVDFRDKLTGKATYGLDARMDNMVYGAVVHAPTIGAEFKSADITEAQSKAGVIQVINEKEFAGVVAESRMEADFGRNAIDATFDEPHADLQQSDIDAMVSIGSGRAVVIQKEGNVKDHLIEGDVILGEYRTPMAAHAHLEPQAAVVHVMADSAVAYVATQFPNTVAGEIASATGLDQENVTVTPTYLGGGFGRKLNTEAAVEAALLSKAVGRPVHVGWNRKEEFRNGYLRPPTHHQLRAKLDNNGKMIAMEHQQSSGDVAFPFFPGIAAAAMGADFGAWRGGRIFYGVPNKRTVAWRAKLPIYTGWWRALGLLANTFAIESFIDRVAAEANADPLQFRLDHMPDTADGARMAQVLETAGSMADWGRSLPEGHALGVACSIDVNAPVAQVAEISIENEPTSGHKIRVHNVWSAFDVGLAVNPDIINAQTQGSIIMGLSSTFFEKITVKNGRVDAANFNNYPLITMKEAPAIHTEILQIDGKPRGVGEPAIGPVPAAVNNALHTLTGLTLTDLPLELPA